MARHIPSVSDGVLHLREPSEEGPTIAVGSASSIAWLTDPATRSFSFRSPRGAYTARKEWRTRGGEYWTAYRRHSGRLRKAYLGKAEDLILDRLDEAATRLARSDDDATAGSALEVSTHEAGTTPTNEATTVGTAPTEDHARQSPHHSTSGDPLLLTKLSVPLPRPALVSRPRLSKRLREGLGCRLTLVSAPAGFGKTTLLSTWLAGSSGDQSAVWLSLDAADNDPARLWRYFIAAADRLRPGAGDAALRLLRSPQAPPIEAVLTTLLNELADLDAEAALVLDDYHLIDSREIHEALTFLIEHLPPHFHLVIATRADPPLPLARLRAWRIDRAACRRPAFHSRGGSSFPRSDDEAQAVGGGDCGAGEAHRRLDSWVADGGARHADRADVPGFIAAFTGSNRYVLDYLVEEVLNQQPEGDRSFLLESSVLSRICGPLCDAVTGRADGQATLERLEHANLFVVPLDNERRWYRYHHLFADVLLQRLREAGVDRPSELHRRASAWFEGQDLVQEAIEHALAAADWQRATRLLIQFSPSFTFRGQFHTVLSWLNALPGDFVRGNPTLSVYYAGAFMYTYQFEAAEIRLQEAE